jgi:hypothetical protein
MQDFEKLGSFYLGKHRDLKAGQTNEDLILYDSKDLTTHAVCVGMTGSGKTGLCLGLLEEAGLDNIPAIVIDPKGDISNLLLTFPNLDQADFRPWIDESQATREGLSPDDFAKKTAKTWKDGLAKWGQDGARIQKFRDSVDLTIYTPGSNAGVPLTILKSFDAPPAEILQDADSYRGRISSAASGLLALLGIDADPVQSREHILLSNIFERNWSAGKNLDLAAIIGQIQQPPFQKVGIMELDKFFPEKDRMSLAMTMNNLLASPTFASWMEGEPLSIKRLLHTESGKPRISILSIAHLSDSERMFFVTILLNELLIWMRGQSGTGSLRALFYMDEVFGYFPPTANPPSKIPMLTLLKQARAFGLGIVLATQNPVDLDYKGLSNTGTWFLGRLQTERDKMRVLEGLEGASASAGSTFNRQEMEATLAGLGNRIFLMNNVHEDHPVVFETRWALSYLRGPLTRNHIQMLMKDRKLASQASISAADAAAAAIRPVGEPIAADKEKKNEKPSVPSGINERFLDTARRLGSSDRLVYRPALYASGRLHFSKSTYKVDYWETRQFMLPVKGDVPDNVWDEATLLKEQLEFSDAPQEAAEFGELPESMQASKSYASWEKDFKSYLYRTQELPVYRCSELSVYSNAGESEGEFRVRLEQMISEKRDTETEKLRKSYASKFETLKGRIRRAEEDIQEQTAQYKQKKMDTLISFGSSVLGAVLGRKIASSTNVTRAGTSMRSIGRAARERGDIGRAEAELKEQEQKFKDLEIEFEAAIEQLKDKLQVSALELESLQVTPRKSDISVEEFCVLWLPFVVDSTGIAEPAY